MNVRLIKRAFVFRKNQFLTYMSASSRCNNVITPGGNGPALPERSIPGHRYFMEKFVTMILKFIRIDQ